MATIKINSMPESVLVSQYEGHITRAAHLLMSVKPTQNVRSKANGKVQHGPSCRWALSLESTGAKEGPNQSTLPFGSLHMRKQTLKRRKLKVFKD